MKNNPKLLQKLMEKIENTPNAVIESAIDKLSTKIILEKYIYNLDIKYDNDNYSNNFYIERENKKWKREIEQLVA